MGGYWLAMTGDHGVPRFIKALETHQRHICGLDL